MKTPHDLLLARHETVRSKLDALRRQVIAKLAPGSDAEEPTRPGFMAQLWAELFWSCRRIWIGLACVWVFILVLHSIGAPTPAPGTARTARPPTTAELRLALTAQARLRAELFGSEPRPHARTSQPQMPGPRSEHSIARYEA